MVVPHNDRRYLDIWPALLVLLGVVAALVWLVRSVSGPKTPTARELAGCFEEVRAMSGPQFEFFVADPFRAMGRRAAMLGGVGDQGVDLVVSYHGERVAIQQKNNKGALGNKPVQEVSAGARCHDCQQASVVAPAGFTRGAYQLARSTGTSFHDANSISRVDQAGGRAREEARAWGRGTADAGQRHRLSQRGSDSGGS